MALLGLNTTSLTTLDVAASLIQSIRNDDPVIHSLDDIDFYKLTMMQLIWLRYRERYVSFAGINRSKTFNLSRTVPIQALREQLDHCQTLGWSRQMLINLRGNAFAGQTRIFREDFLQWLAQVRLPEYEIFLDSATGDYKVRFGGPWCESTGWETLWMSIASEMRTRYALKGLTRSEVKVFYARATDRIYGKLRALAGMDGLSISEFGTRRRNSLAWHVFVLQMMQEMLGDKLVGTSNVMLAQAFDMEAIGNTAHELVMVTVAQALEAYANGAATREQVIQSQYETHLAWKDLYGGNMFVLLPDTFGSTQFFRNAPGSLVYSRGIRYDSKDPLLAIQEGNAFYVAGGQDPATRKHIPTDGLNPQSIGQILSAHLPSTPLLSFGWGTGATNDMEGLFPVGDPDELKAASIVCKPIMVDGIPVVKLSDNAAKRTGDKDRIRLAVEVFGEEGVSNVQPHY